MHLRKHTEHKEQNGATAPALDTSAQFHHLVFQPCKPGSRTPVQTWHPRGSRSALANDAQKPPSHMLCLLGQPSYGLMALCVLFLYRSTHGRSFDARVRLSRTLTLQELLSGHQTSRARSTSSSPNGRSMPILHSVWWTPLQTRRLCYESHLILGQAIGLFSEP